MAFPTDYIDYIPAQPSKANVRLLGSVLAQSNNSMISAWGKLLSRVKETTLTSSTYQGNKVTDISSLINSIFKTNTVGDLPGIDVFSISSEVFSSSNIWRPGIYGVADTGKSINIKDLLGK